MEGDRLTPQASCAEESARSRAGMQQPCQAIMGYIAVAEKKCGPQNETTFSPHNLCNTRPPKRDHFLTQKDARIWLQKRNHFLTPRTRPHCGPKNETTARKTRPLSDSKREPRKGLRKHGQKRSRKQDPKTVMRTTVLHLLWLCFLPGKRSCFRDRISTPWRANSKNAS